MGEADPAEFIGGFIILILFGLPFTLWAFISSIFQKRYDASFVYGFFVFSSLLLWVDIFYRKWKRNYMSRVSGGTPT